MGLLADIHFPSFIHLCYRKPTGVHCIYGCYLNSSHMTEQEKSTQQAAGGSSSPDLMWQPIVWASFDTDITYILYI